MTHDPRDPSRFVDPFDPWPMTHWPTVSHDKKYCDERVCMCLLYVSFSALISKATHPNFTKFLLCTFTAKRLRSALIAGALAAVTFANDCVAGAKSAILDWLPCWFCTGTMCRSTLCSLAVRTKDWTIIWNTERRYVYTLPDSWSLIALCNRADHYIFALWFLSLFFFPSPNLIGRRLDVYHILRHMVWPSANLECRSETCCTRLAANSGRKKVAKSPKIAIWAPSHNFVGLYLRN